LVFEPQEEGGYHVYAPDLPGLHAQGDDPDGAMANAGEAVASTPRVCARTATARRRRQAAPGSGTGSHISVQNPPPLFHESPVTQCKLGQGDAQRTSDWPQDAVELLRRGGVLDQLPVPALPPSVGPGRQTIHQDFRGRGRDDAPLRSNRGQAASASTSFTMSSSCRS
jgi:hypothetical protein